MASHHDQTATFLEEAFHALLCEVEDGVDVAAPVGGASRVSEKHEVVPGQGGSELSKYGQTPEARVIDADHVGTRFPGERVSHPRTPRRARVVPLRLAAEDDAP